jgi:hypothetical protein
MVSQAEKNKTAPSASQFTPKVSKGNVKLECSNSGYTKMVRELLALVLFLATFAKETFSAMLPENLQYSVNYAYAWLLGVGDWIGYAIGALYYFSVEYNFGDTLCEIMGYGYVLIDNLQILVTFTEASKAEKQNVNT